MRHNGFKRLGFLLLVIVLLVVATAVFAQEGGEDEGESEAAPIAQVEEAQAEAPNSQWLTILMFFAGVGAIGFVGLLTLVRRGAINVRMPESGAVKQPSQPSH